MAGSVNKVILIGNVGKDPEIRTLPSGGKVANLRIATSENWRDKQTGEKRERTEWHSVVIFGDGLIRVVESYVSKGSKLYIEGQLQTRKWQDRDGNDRYSTDVVLQGFGGTLTMLDSRSGGALRDGGRPDYDAGRGGDQVDAPQSGGSQEGASGGFDKQLDDEIPF